MEEFIESKDKLIITIDEEYWQAGDVLEEDNLVICAIKYLRRIGKLSDFIGFDVLNRYVLLINSESYCITRWGNKGSSCPKITLKKADMEVRENRFKDRVTEIQGKLINDYFSS